MSGAAHEFSRPVPLTRLDAEPFRLDVAASETERAALARRFDLVSLDRLTASVELVREGGGTILLRATFAADFAQTCIVTLDPVPGTVEDSFALRYGPPEAEPSDPPTRDDEPAFEPLTGDAIDVGEAVAQEFSLALPLFPRAAGAVVEEAAVTEEDALPAASDGPFAALARLARRQPG
jgi:uncharacterized metal-binding protein YceD (DUF177 family)